MYVNPIAHKDDIEQVINFQIRGWAFESHYWVDGPYPRKCQWCGQEAIADMQMEGAITLCRKNPYLMPLVQTLKEMAIAIFEIQQRGIDEHAKSINPQYADRIIEILGKGELS